MIAAKKQLMKETAKRGGAKRGPVAKRNSTAGLRSRSAKAGSKAE
jgi:hypothetical protein